jgi:hypothetical protein
LPRFILEINSNLRFTMPQEVNQESETGARDSTERPTRRPPWPVFALFLASAVVLLALFGWSVHSGTLLIAELLVGTAATSVGGLLGFLFGLPRAPVQSETRDTPAGDKPSVYRPSNNLEQVSDWLTKILIGVGLVQLAKLSTALNTLGVAVATSLKNPPPGTDVVTQIVVISFLVFGFLASFLWTRIYYGPLQAIADQDVYKELEKAKQEALIQKESKERAVSIASDIAEGQITTPATFTRPEEETKRSQIPIESALWSDDVRKKLEEFRKAAADWNDDTAARIFRSPPSETNGKILEADFLMELRHAAVINLRIRSTTNQPLEGPVTFVLHPSFTKSVLEVQPRGDKAETKITAGEWFTVVAILDHGKTVLSYDLRKMAGAPEWFK